MSKRDVIRKLAGKPPILYLCDYAAECGVDGMYYDNDGRRVGSCIHASPHKKDFDCDGACQIHRESHFCREVKDHDKCNNVV